MATVAASQNDIDSSVGVASKSEHLVDALSTAIGIKTESVFDEIGIGIAIGIATGEGSVACESVVGSPLAESGRLGVFVDEAKVLGEVHVDIACVVIRTVSACFGVGTGGC